jgi:hypothetical protein
MQNLPKNIAKIVALRGNEHSVSTCLFLMHIRLHSSSLSLQNKQIVHRSRRLGSIPGVSDFLRSRGSETRSTQPRE